MDRLDALALTEPTLEFSVPGEPQGKGRARVGRVGKHVRMFTPPKTMAYEGLIAHAAAAAYPIGALIEHPCVLFVTATFSVPASWSKRKQEDALRGRVHPTKKPDVDNIAKAVADSLNGVIWRDDAQVVCAMVLKEYGKVPGLRVRIYAI